MSAMLKRAPDITLACAQMHENLLAWGRIVLVGGSGAHSRHRWESDSTREYIEFSAADIDAAYALHHRVNELPEVRMRFALHVFYHNIVASEWQKLSDARQAELLADMADEVNAGIRRFNRYVLLPALPITAEDFEGIRERSIRILVNNERMGL